MKIAVIGAGIVGLCTAYELALDGHEVDVFERNSSVAQEASFACGGHLSPSLTHPMAFPHWPTGSWLSSLFALTNISVRKGSSLSDLRWLYHWKLGGKKHWEALATGHGLAAYSLQRLQAISLAESLVREQSQGHMLLWQSEAAFNKFDERIQTMKSFGLVVKILGPDEARVKEPALQADFAFHAASYFPEDEIGNCRQFAHLLKEKMNQLGAKLHFGATIHGVSNTTGIELQIAGRESYKADQVIICAGTDSAGLAVSNKSLPLTTVWSHSLSAPIREPLNAPRSAVQDTATRMTVTRLGARVRVCGGAALGSLNRGNDENTVKDLYRTLNTLFPGAADFSRNAQVWKGASQFTPDGLPIIGPSTVPGIWLNVGHGHNGWSMACGSARIVADLVAGKASDVDTTKVGASRFQS